MVNSTHCNTYWNYNLSKSLCRSLAVETLHCDHALDIQRWATSGINWTITGEIKAKVEGASHICSPHPKSLSQRANVYTDLDRMSKPCQIPPQSPLKKGTSDPVPSFLRRVREDQSQPRLDQTTCVYTVAQRARARVRAFYLGEASILMPIFWQTLTIWQ